MKKIINKTQGITLIALVITIVILIILAGVLVNLTIGENGLFTRTKLAKIRYEYAAAKEIVDVKLVDIQAECMTEGEEYTLDIIADRIGDEEEISTDIIHFYATAKNKSDNERPTGIERIKGILVSANQYPQFKFLIGEAGNVIKVIGITTEDVQTTWTTGDLPAGFKTIEKFEEEIGVNAVSANQGGQEGTTYTITYNANGGSGTMTVTTGTNPQVETNSFTPPAGMEFKEWNTLADGTGTKYEVGAKVNQTIELFAIWEIDNRLASVVSIGDYVAYDAGTTTTYNSSDPKTYKSVKGTGSSHGNGNSDQTFLSSSSIKWRVLKIENDQVVLISETPIGDLTLNGAIGYLYAEEEINKACSIYGHGYGADTSKSFTCQTGEELQGYDTVTLTGSGARSINIDDIDRICGITTDEQKQAIAAAYGTKPEIGSHYYPTKTKSDGKSTSAADRRETWTDYYYTGSTYLTNTSEEPYKMLFRNKEDNDNVKYWIASRTVEIFQDAAKFRVRPVIDGSVDSKLMCEGKSDGLEETNRTYTYGLRPVVYLESTLRTSGKVNDEWQLQ